MTNYKPLRMVSGIWHVFVKQNICCSIIYIRLNYMKLPFL
jgi:hypothetical protein